MLTKLIASLIVLSTLTMQQAHAVQWTAFTSIGGVIKGAPSFISGVNGSGEKLFIVAVRGMDDALWVNRKVGSGPWSGFKSLGGTITSDPTCSFLENNIANCFALDINHQLVYKPYSAGVWLKWYPTSYDLTINGPVSVFSPDTDFIKIVATGTMPGSTVAKPYQIEWHRHPYGGFPGDPTYKPEGWQKWKSLAEPTFPEAQNVNSRVVCDGFFDRVPKGGSAYGLNIRPIPLGGCLSPFYNGEHSYTISTFGGDVFPDLKRPYSAFLLLNDMWTMFVPSMYMTREQGKGLVANIFYIHKDKSLRFKRWVHAVGWDKFSNGATEKNFGGVITSSPSCTNLGCAVRGQDGAVWVTGAFE